MIGGEVRERNHRQHHAKGHSCHEPAHGSGRRAQVDAGERLGFRPGSFYPVSDGTLLGE